MPYRLLGRDERSVIVAVVTVLVMQVISHEIVDVIAVRDRWMPTAR
jgi:hypothetical protein